MLETFKHYKEVKHIMIMIIAIIYIFLSYVILINSWKLLSENPQAPLKKSTSPFLLSLLKIQKVQVPPFCQQNWMLCLHNAGDMLETFKHYKEVKHIMIMIIAIIYIFLSYVILINSWKLLSENPQAPVKKSTSPFLLSPLKIQKVQVPPFCQH